MSRRTLVLLGALGLLAVGFSTLAAPRRQAAAAPAQESFGRPIFVLSRETGRQKADYVLDKAEVRQVGGRAFLVGRAMKTNLVADGFSGRTVWVPLDGVTQIVEMEGVVEAK